MVRGTLAQIVLLGAFISPAFASLVTCYFGQQRQRLERSSRINSTRFVRLLNRPARTLD